MRLTVTAPLDNRPVPAWVVVEDLARTSDGLLRAGHVVAACGVVALSVPVTLVVEGRVKGDTAWWVETLKGWGYRDVRVNGERRVWPVEDGHVPVDGVRVERSGEEEKPCSTVPLG